ncbi:hypothetical protein QOT17_013410 [Balamuthia mandrillaris]
MQMSAEVKKFRASKKIKIKKNLVQKNCDDDDALRKCISSTIFSLCSSGKKSIKQNQFGRSFFKLPPPPLRAQSVRTTRLHPIKINQKKEMCVEKDVWSFDENANEKKSIVWQQRRTYTHQKKKAKTEKNNNQKEVNHHKREDRGLAR